MTRQTNARIAGFTFLLYIATALPAAILFRTAASGDGIAAKLANIARHAADVRVAAVLSLLTFVEAVVLGVTLYGITRDEDNELAVLALSCRVAEGVINALSPVMLMGLLWLATNSADPAPADPAVANALGALLLKAEMWQTIMSASCFAVGSTVFAYLFLRARTIPAWLAWVGLIGSALLVLCLPLQLAGFIGGPFTNAMWLPAAVFEIVLGFWLIIKGVGAARIRP